MPVPASNASVGRDIELADLMESRWETLVAAGSGPGWSRAIYAISSVNGGVWFNVLCGSHVVADQVGPNDAIWIYNQIAAKGKNFAVDDPESQ